MVILGEMVGHLFCSKLYITRTIKHFLDDSISYYEMQENKIAGRVQEYIVWSLKKINKGIYGWKPSFINA